MSAARLALRSTSSDVLVTWPDITLEVKAGESFVDVLVARCSAGIRHKERRERTWSRYRSDYAAGT